MRKAIWVLAAAGLLTGCSDTGDADISQQQVIHPASSVQIEAETLTIELSASIAYVAHCDYGTLAGGAGGLFQSTTAGLVQLSVDPVVGMAGFDEVIIVATGGGISVWDGTLRPAAIGQSIEGTPTAMRADGDNLWIATDAGLFLLEGEELSAFTGLAAASYLAGCADSNELVVEAGGSIQLLRNAAGEWTLEDLSDEPITQIVPAAGNRILGIRDGLLLERVSVPDGVTWRRVSLRVEAQDTGATDVEAIATDPATGSTWIVQPSTLTRLHHDMAETIPRPALGPLTMVAVTRDGNLWLADSDALVRVGASRAVTWGDDIALFNTSNCTRCHIEGGIGHSLETRESWEREIDDIIAALDDSQGPPTMPQDGVPLVGGTVDLVRQWKEGGLQ